MAKHTLSAKPRQLTGRKVKQLRRQGQIPASLFGKKIKSTNIQVIATDFLKTYAQVGESTLLYLKVDGETDPHPVMVADVVYHPVSRQALHASFHQVDLKEKVIIPVPVQLTGIAPAEKEKLGILVQQADTIEVEGLPTNMPEHLDADVSSLTEVDQAIYAKDIKLGAKLTLQSDPGTIVAKIEPLAKEEPKAAPPAAEATATEETPAETPTKEGTPTPGKSPVESKDKTE